MQPSPNQADHRLDTPISLLLISCMLLATLPAITFPRVTRILSAASDIAYPWQFFTTSFTHGWAFLPPLIHLAANLSLFFFAGPWTERLLGSARYLLLMLAAILAAGLVRALPGDGPTGASAFVLACGPVLLYHWMAIRKSEPLLAFRKLWLGLLALTLMLGAPLIYGTWLARQTSTPLLGFFQANAAHLSAFLVGGLAVALWKTRMAAPAGAGPIPPEELDRAATAAAALLPAGLMVLILLGALRMI
jgi:membrane associated rhomboid family serine protease